MRVSFPLPLLTIRGVYVLIGGAAMLLATSLLGLPISSSLMAIVVFVVAVTISIGIEWNQARRFLRLVTFEMSGPQAVLSGRDAEVKFILRANIKPGGRTTSVELRLEPLAEVRSSNEVVIGLWRGGGADLVVPHTITPLSRGCLIWERVYVRIRRRGWLATWQSTVKLDVPFRTVAVPNFLCAEDIPKSAVLKQLTGERRTAGLLSEGREFDSLRPYAVGDDLRTVDWKRSARSTGLVVKTYRPETHQRLEILLDCSRRTSTRIGDRLQLDYMVDAVSYLMRIAGANRDELGLFAFNHTVVTRIPSNRSQRQERLITDALISLEPGQLEADFELITAYGRSLRRRALVVLLTSVSNPTAIETIHTSLGPLRSRHLPLVVSIADTGLQTLAAQVADTVTDVYRAAAAQEQLEEIERRMRWLKNAGIESAYTELPLLPLVLAAKYEEMKRRGKW